MLPDSHSCLQAKVSYHCHLCPPLAILLLWSISLWSFCSKGYLIIKGSKLVSPSQTSFAKCQIYSFVYQIFCMSQGYFRVTWSNILQSHLRLCFPSVLVNGIIHQHHSQSSLIVLPLPPCPCFQSIKRSCRLHLQTRSQTVHLPVSMSTICPWPLPPGTWTAIGFFPCYLSYSHSSLPFLFSHSYCHYLLKT
jgi:hypothetical protein